MSSSSVPIKKKIAIVGGGVSALMLACELNSEKYDITIFESNGSLGRKFLVAGDGGLNLTHSEDKTKFIERYTPSLFLEKPFSHFSNTDLIKWINDLGIETFVGTSGRVFPKKGIKPAEVLNAIVTKLKNNSVALKTKHTWHGFTKTNDLKFISDSNSIEVKNDLVIFCLGGASWPVTGSKGDWLNYFTEKGIVAHPFMASNCAFKIGWDKNLISKIESKVLKNISITCKDKTHFGEIVITKFGIEGSGIYPLSSQIRDQLTKNTSAEITIDLKPGFTLEKVIEKLTAIAGKKNFTDNLKTDLNLSLPQIHLLKTIISKEDFLDVTKLAFHIKNFKLTVTGSAPIDEAISTVGGISLKEITPNFELKKLPCHFTVGEMLDYDAPTGGYLLQSCFSMGSFLAHYLNSKND